MAPGTPDSCVVLLGAGASLAAFPNGDRDGRRLPLMDHVIELVGFAPRLDEAGINWKSRDRPAQAEVHAEPWTLR